jgi:hypothetical protein
MGTEALTFWSVAIDCLALMICIGAVVLARRTGRPSPVPVLAAVPAFGDGVDREMLRQDVASAFARIADSLETERQSLDAVFAPASVKIPAPPAEDPNTAIGRMAARGIDVAAMARELGRSPGEVELRLKLKPPSERF